MAKNKHPLRINIGFLLNQPVGASREFDFDFDHIILPPDLALANFSGKAKVSRIRQGLLVEGEFGGTVEDECVRCLGPAYQELNASFQELFAFKNHPISESDLFVPEDGYIDLGPLATEYLMIEIPINPLCSADCRGLCSICGENLNQEPEHVHVEMEE